MRKLNDFGEKIGGAKKDIWAIFNSLSDEEQGEMARKSKLWKRPNYQALISEGVPKEVCYWQDKMRRAVIPKPKENTKKYIKFVLALKADVEACSNMKDIRAFYAGNPEKDDSAGVFQYLKKVSEDPSDRHWKYADETTKPFFNGNELLRYVYQPERLIADCKLDDFLETREEKEDKKYQIESVTPENIKSEPHPNGGFKNNVKTKYALSVYCDTKDYSELIKQAKDNTLYIVLYDHRKIGVCLSKEDAEDMVAKVKSRKEEEKKKKETFLPTHLAKIERTGSNYDVFRFTDGNILKARYGLRGGEFGNYTTSKDRLGGINMAYDAFEDLYKAIGISHKDISLGGQLAIAFGARGRGNAMAHYEPLRNVINMTKKRGAGSLAHEWGHAMDAYLGEKMGVHGFMSASISSDKVPESAKALIEAFKEQNGKETSFYAASKGFDNEYTKAGNGYWSSMPEMFARAFACYVRDKLENKKSDYLVGHSEFAVSGAMVAIPVGEERKIIDEKFDMFISDMINLGFFSKEKKERTEQAEVTDVIFYEGNGGQLMFC